MPKQLLSKPVFKELLRQWYAFHDIPRNLWQEDTHWALYRQHPESYDHVINNTYSVESKETNPS